MNIQKYFQKKYRKYLLQQGFHAFFIVFHTYIQQSFCILLIFLLPFPMMQTLRQHYFDLPILILSIFPIVAFFYVFLHLIHCTMPLSQYVQDYDKQMQGQNLLATAFSILTPKNPTQKYIHYKAMEFLQTHSIQKQKIKTLSFLPIFLFFLVLIHWYFPLDEIVNNNQHRWNNKNIISQQKNIENTLKQNHTKENQIKNKTKQETDKQKTDKQKTDKQKTDKQKTD
ncbi:MAG TPA: hypothetical protein P5543_11740, partial [Planctomycetota bacterium]|nr:hypothetical protein [Planctomycetota bacterium]HRU52848.1 hypothetical protein [Planctomycetota bacterium]